MKASEHPKFHETWEELQKAYTKLLDLCHTEPSEIGRSVPSPGGATYKQAVHETVGRIHRAQRRLEAIMIHSK